MVVGDTGSSAPSQQKHQNSGRRYFHCPERANKIKECFWLSRRAEGEKLRGFFSPKLEPLVEGGVYPPPSHSISPGTCGGARIKK